MKLAEEAAGYCWPSCLEVSDPIGGIDLLFAMVHEWGHALGYEQDRLCKSLAVGVRILPLMVVSPPWIELQQPPTHHGLEGW
jgi:hypothetical protein